MEFNRYEENCTDVLKLLLYNLSWISHIAYVKGRLPAVSCYR